jgi:hypothetical protein
MNWWPAQDAKARFNNFLETYLRDGPRPRGDAQGYCNIALRLRSYGHLRAQVAARVREAE